jgi:hemolysin activation/secretion protein
LGGARTIRGLEEREVAGDDGIRASLEIYTPDLGAGDRLLVFTDFGRYWRQNPLPGEVSHDNIWTAGIGWRWNLPNQFNAGVDLGYAIDGATLTKSGDLRLHFNLQYQF